MFAIAVVGVVLSPYATTWLRFRQALEVQAVMVLAFTLIPIVGWFLTGGWRRPLTDAPAAVDLGILLYSSAAVLGTVVAVIRGNEARLIAGQLLSMGLLPLGYIATRSVAQVVRHSMFVRSLVGSTVFASFIHFVYWSHRLRIGDPQVRLYLPNAVSMAGLVLMALLLAVAAVLVSNGRHRVLALSSTTVLAVYLVGTGTRSLWMATTVGAAIFLVIEILVGPKSTIARVIVVVAIGAGVAGVGALALAARLPKDTVFPQDFFFEPYWRAPPDSQVVVKDRGQDIELVLPPHPGNTRNVEPISNPTVLDSGELYLASAEGMGMGSGSAAVNFLFSLASRHVCHVVTVPFKANVGWTRAEVPALQVPDEAVLVHVTVERNSADSSEWRFRRINLERFESRMPQPIARQLLYLRHRLLTPIVRVFNQPIASLPSLDLRIQESLSLAREMRGSSAIEVVVGHGLGARFKFSTRGYDATGLPIEIDNPNYIHNFYAFLLYKLGVIGTLLVLGAVGLWIGWAVRRLTKLRAIDHIHWIAAYLAIWLAYLAWAVFCPELIDFRVAPVVGMLIGSIGTGGEESRADEPPSLT